MTPSLTQKPLLNRIIDFIQSGSGDIFILKGYAGTGKTTMIKFIVEYLKSKSVEYQ